MASVSGQPGVELRLRKAADGHAAADDRLPVPPRVPPKSHFFQFFADYSLGVILGCSLAVHLGLIGLAIFLDSAWQMPSAASETPIELVSEEQARKGGQGSGQEQPKTDSQQADVKGSPSAPDAKTDASKRTGSEPSEPEDGEKTQAKPQDPPAAQQARDEQAKGPPAKAEQAKLDESKAKPADSKPPPAKGGEKKASGAPDKPEPKSPAKPAPIPSQAKPADAQKPPSQEEVQSAEQQQKPPARQPAPPPAAADRAQTQTPRPAQPMQDAATMAASTPEASQSQPQSAPLPPIATFLSQPMDNFSLAIAAPVPTNDQNGELMSYKVAVYGQLERAKDIPETARRRHAQGTVTIYFEIDQSGQPQKITMLESSGQADLDVEGLAMVVRAAPFPVPPEGAQRVYAINIVFSSDEPSDTPDP